MRTPLSTFDWTGSQNIRAVAFHWPEPSIYVDKGVRTIGYQNELILPISITPSQAGEPVAVKGSVVIGVCEDICIPVEASFNMEITGQNVANQSAIKAALKRQAKSGKAAGLQNVSCEITPIEDGFHIAATLKARNALPASTFAVFEFPHSEVWVEQDRTVASGDTLTASANLYTYGDTPLILDRSKIMMTLFGGRRAIELRGCPS